MSTEIKRKVWSQFCKKFNASNQYRLANVSVKTKGRNAVEVDRDAPFMGIALARNGRLIDGIELYTGKYDPDKLKEPIISIKQPDKVLLETDDTGADGRLTVRTKDGTEVNISLSGQKDPERHRSLVEKMAYTMYERRGYQTGREFDDWVEAEKRVKETELELTR